MKIDDFKIGEVFIASAGFEWLCTDKGTRTITAIMLEPNKESYWFKGPPYHIDEQVFNEYDMLACYTNTDSMIQERIKKTSHPGFSSKDVFKMMKGRDSKYHRKNILKRDRVANDGAILHPYNAVNKEGKWYIKTFDIFSHEYSEMHEDLFVQLCYSNEAAIKKRKTQVKDNQ